MKGHFISFEGGEGSGKSTQAELLVNRLRSEGYRVVRTREPGGTPLAERIREVLLTPIEEEMSSNTELLLMFASRAQHIERVIAPALSKGSVVVCDRYIDSTFAYQHYGRMVSDAKIQALFTLTCRGLLPDTTVHLDLPTEIGMQRASKRGQLDRIELEDKAFFTRVAQGFRERAKQDPTRFVNIDATQPIEWITERIYKATVTRLNAAGYPTPKP